MIKTYNASCKYCSFKRRSRSRISCRN